MLLFGSTRKCFLKLNSSNYQQFYDIRELVHFVGIMESAKKSNRIPYLHSLPVFLISN